MCINIYLRHGNACLCFNVFIVSPSRPTPDCPPKRKKQQKNEEFLSSNKSSDFFFASFCLLRSSTPEMSAKLFLCLSVHVSCPPHERRLCIGRFDENRRIKLKQHIETAKIRFRLQKATESKILNPERDGSG